MAFEYAQVDCEENASNTTSFEKESFPTDEELATLRRSTHRSICSLRNIFLLFPWLLVIGLSAVLAHTAKVSLGRREELGLEHYSMRIPGEFPSYNGPVQNRRCYV